MLERYANLPFDCDMEFELSVKPLDVKVAVLGSGTMGTALSAAAARCGRRCVLWTTEHEVMDAINKFRIHPKHFSGVELPALVQVETDLSKAVGEADVVVVALPSDMIRTVASRLISTVSRSAAVVSATKGLERHTNLTMTAVLSEMLPNPLLGAISGPNITQDIMAARPTALVTASESIQCLQALSLTFDSETLRTFPTSNIRAIEYLGALKNIVVIAAGIAAGLELGDNFRSFLIALGLREIELLTGSLGVATAGTPDLAGIGDLFLSATSQFSRNHEVGVQIGRGMPIASLLATLNSLGETAEGINSVRCGFEIADMKDIELPLLQCLHAILFEECPAKMLASLLNHRRAHEIIR